MPEEPRPAAPAADERRLKLRADCERCFALCCVVPAFSASADFAIDKDAGRPCPNLRADFRCGIHNRLRQQGFPGCTVYDCFGAGQQVAQVTFGGRDWRQSPQLAAQMFETFTIMRQLHELLWYLTEALTRKSAGPIHEQLGTALDETERLTHRGPDELKKLDLAAHWQEVNALLLRASELGRAEVPASADRPPRCRPDREGPQRRRPAWCEPERGLPDRRRPQRREPADGRPDRR